MLGGYGNQKSVANNRWIPYFKAFMAGQYASIDDARAAYYQANPQANSPAAQAKRDYAQAKRVQRKSIRQNIEASRDSYGVYRASARGKLENLVEYRKRDGTLGMRLQKGIVAPLPSYHNQYRAALKQVRKPSARQSLLRDARTRVGPPPGYESSRIPVSTRYPRRARPFSLGQRYVGPSSISDEFKSGSFTPAASLFAYQPSASSTAADDKEFIDYSNFLEAQAVDRANARQLQEEAGLFETY
jgi:hypothetical protein